MLLYVDDQKDPAEPFRGSLEFFSVQSRNPHYTLLGDLNNTLTASTSLQNSFSATGTIYSSKGYTRTSVYRSVDYVNLNTLQDLGNFQVIDQNTKILSSTLTEHFGVGASSTLQVENYEYPLRVNLSYFKNESGYEYDVNMSHQRLVNKSVKKNQDKFMPIENLVNSQQASGYFGTIRAGIAQLEQNYSYEALDQCYQRSIRAYNRTVISDNLGC
jgi:hypothetical protein